MAILSEFNVDVYPQKPRVLFIGLSESSHTRLWIDLLDKAELNVRLFATPTGTPPDQWGVQTYLTTSIAEIPDSDIRATLDDSKSVVEWLAYIVREWQPHIVHTLGLEPAGYLYYEACRTFNLIGLGKWVLQLRGGSDISLNQYDSEIAHQIAQVLRVADQIIANNTPAYEFAKSVGVREDQLSPLGMVPGTGGVEVDELLSRSKKKTSERRIIVYPKAYNSPWSIALPILEALKQCWERIQPCEVYMFAMSSEVRLWYKTLPQHIRECCHTAERSPRKEVLDLLLEARVMLAPSLIDGIPNTLYEAMATGAFPVVSPLDTITPVVKSEQNVLFARNLYPDEIAGALVRAMSDDYLVNQAAQTNLQLVRQLADRATLRPRLLAYYGELADNIDRQAPILSGTASLDAPLPVLSSLSGTLTEEERYAALYREYMITQKQLITLQRNYTKLHEEYKNSQGLLAQGEKNYSALLQEYLNVHEQLVKCQQKHTKSRK